jgi:[ribosomal protein S5]-alanine N-acetyltransferase
MCLDQGKGSVMKVFKREGFRVYLRPLEATDIDERYVSWFAEDDSHLRYYSGSGRRFTPDVLRQDLRNALESGSNFFYAIVDVASEEVIGNVRIGPVQTVHKTSDLVALIGERRFVGKRLAREAIVIGNDIAFGEHDIRKLSSGMLEQNVPSIKAYLSAGWVLEGRLKGQYLVDGQPSDRILVACFNPKYFPAGAA